jgi:transcriptional regulator with XRE-family HTH domain
MAKRDDPIKLLGLRVREVRKAKGLSQSALAERASLSLNFIGLVERGVTSPSLATLFRIARSLGVSVADLFLTAEAIQRSSRNQELLQRLILLLRRRRSADVQLVLDFTSRILEHIDGRKR